MGTESPDQNLNSKPSWLKPGETIKITEEGEFEIVKVAGSIELGKELGLNITRDVPVYFLKGISPARQGAYHPKADLVLMFENNTEEHTLKHELVHVVEYHQEPTPELLALYERVKTIITEDTFLKSNQSGFVSFNFSKNIHEFIADGYTNEIFIVALKKEGLYDDFLKQTEYLFKT